MGLFTTNTHSHKEITVPYEKNVTVISAPTDDSLKILQEMKEKTLDNILDVQYVNNYIDGVIVTTKKNFEKLGITYYFAFTLNGKQFRFEIEKNDFELSKEELFVEFNKKAIQSIAKLVLQEQWKSIL